MGSFDGRVGIVTGGGSGIGRAAVRRFAEAGASVVVCDIDDETGESAAAEVRAMGGTAVFHHADVTDEEQVAGLVDAALTEFGRLDFAHNNAGGNVGTPAETADLSSETWHETIALNLHSGFYLLKHELHAMLPRGGGAIVATASGRGQNPAPGLQAYAAGKHGIIGLYRSAAAEYGDRGMRINIVAPGPIRTPLMEAWLDSEPGKREEKVKNLGKALGRLGEPEEIAAAAVWLCSDEASYVTGTVFQVDGGQAR
jgi:NAD(P)-dependent dehydrogenase (short-subunit alcohol dehydrogenase family)